MWQSLFQKKEVPGPAAQLSDQQWAELSKRLTEALHSAMAERGYVSSHIEDIRVELKRDPDVPSKIQMQVTAPYLGEPWDCDIGDGAFRDFMASIRWSGKKHGISRTKEEPELPSADDDLFSQPKKPMQYQYTFSGYRCSDLMEAFNSGLSPHARLDIPALLGKGIS